MAKKESSKTDDTLPNWALKSLPFVSFLFAGTATLGAAFRYDVFTASHTGWFEPTQALMHTILLGIAGMIWFIATALLALNKDSGWNLFTAGFFTVAAILPLNLLLFGLKTASIRLPDFFPAIGEKLGNFFTNPISLIFVFVVIAVIVASVIGEIKKEKK